MIHVSIWAASPSLAGRRAKPEVGCSGADTGRRQADARLRAPRTGPSRLSRSRRIGRIPWSDPIRALLSLDARQSLRALRETFLTREPGGIEVANLESLSCARARDGAIVPVNMSKARRCDRGGVEDAGILANATTRVTETCLSALRSMTPSRSVAIDRRVRVIARTSEAKRAWVVVHPIDRVISYEASSQWVETAVMLVGVFC